MITLPLRSRRGFTLAELIIVMMIIVLLVAILLPALGSARKRAKKVASQAQLTSIDKACEAYIMQMYHAPGYFSQSQLSASALWKDFTGTENLVVSLLGQVVTAASAGSAWDPVGVPTTFNNPTNYAVDLNAIGSGPKTAQGRVYGSFYSPKPNELGVVTGNGFKADNNMPELLDGSSGAPILYYRAGSGYTKPVDLLWTATGGKLSRIDNVVYTNAEPLTTPDGETYNNGLKSLLSNNPAARASGDNQGEANANLAWAAINTKISAVTTGSNTSSNNDNNDVIAGSYLLVSPGPDGIYFNVDDIGKKAFTEPADLSKGDDSWAVGGAN